MVAGPRTHVVYLFGPFRADFEGGDLRKHGIRLHIQQQPLRVLGLLAERPDQLVTRQEIVEQLWPGHTAEEFDDSLNSTVKKLREALGDDPGKPLYVETIPRRGYRFIAPIQVEQSETLPKIADAAAGLPEPAPSPASKDVTESAPPRTSWKSGRFAAIAGFLGLCAVVGFIFGSRALKHAAAESPPRSIAVLPFQNLSGDASQDYYAEGLTDALTTDLAELGTIKVISRASANHYQMNQQPLKQIREELGVEAVVEGTYTRSRDKVRVNARLVSTGDDRNLWAQSFERDAGDILSLEDDLAQSVAQKIQLALTPEQRTRLSDARPVNFRAYEALLNGMHDLNFHRTNNELLSSLEQFNEAIRIDPKLPQAYAGKATAYNLLGDYDGMRGTEAGPKAEQAARRALELDPSMAFAHSALAFTLWKYDWDWKAAEAEFQKALDLNPNNAHAHHIYAVFLACEGNFAAADQHMRIALTLDPLSMIIRTNLGWMRYFQHDFTGAESALTDVLKLDPGFVPARQKLWITYAEEGKKEQAAAELENLMRLFGHRDLLQIVDRAGAEQRYAAGVQAYADSGVLSAYEKARYLALLGKKREAVLALQDAAAQRSSWIVYLRIEPVFDPMRDMPEFQKLVDEARIPEPAAK